MLRCNLSARGEGFSRIHKVSITGIISEAVPESGHRVLAADNGDIYFTGGWDVHRWWSEAGTVRSFTFPDDTILGGAALHTSGSIYVVGARRFAPTLLYTCLPDLSKCTMFDEVPASYVTDIAVNSAGDVFVATTYQGILKRLNTSKDWSQVDLAAAGRGLQVTGIDINAAGDILLSEASYDGCSVWLMEAATGNLRHVAGILDKCGVTLDPTDATNTMLGSPTDVAFGPDGTSVYIVDANCLCVLIVDLKCVK